MPITHALPSFALAALADTFSATHIALTALITGAIAAALAAWRFTGRERLVGSATVGALSAAAVFLWRKSANMPQLNKDGLSGYSANDWLAPVLTFVVLTIYADLRPPADPRRFGQIRALVTIAAFAVNVITI
jgi:hypothetical protein